MQNCLGLNMSGKVGKDSCLSSLSLGHIISIDRVKIEEGLLLQADRPSSG